MEIQSTTGYVRDIHGFQSKFGGSISKEKICLFHYNKAIKPKVIGLGELLRRVQEDYINENILTFFLLYL